MNKQLSLILVQAIKDGVYVDRISGLVQTVKRTIPSGEEGFTITKALPFSMTASQDERNNLQMAMIPDSSRKTVIYFEDGPIRSLGEERHGTRMESSMRLVCWINTLKINPSDLMLGAKIQADIINRVCFASASSGPFINIKPRVSSIPPAGPALFPYDYDERAVQYLLHPFDAFALDLEIQFTISRNCSDLIVFSPEIKC